MEYTFSGSSPRGRGTPVDNRWAGSHFRWFIPARAGNAHAAKMTTSANAVHPRAGGERTLAHSGATEPNGSSPRGRGTPREDVHE